MTFINRLQGYKIVYTPLAKKELKNIDKVYMRKIEQKLHLLVQGSSNLDIKRLVGEKIPTFRLRVGIYRVLFEIQEHEITVLVISVGHRGEVYKD
jgi:mRNA interferase RelE/StbE